MTSLSLVSFLSYIYALGRTDFTHLKQVFGFPIIFLSCYLLFYLFYFIYQKYKFHNYDTKNFLLLLIPFLIVIHINLNIDYSKIINFKDRLIKYVQLDDNSFLTKIDIDFIKQISPLIENEKCIQLYTNDAALLYFLKKPSCTKYYFVWIIGSKKNQIDFIQELNDTNFIIKNGVIDRKMILHKWGLALDIKYPVIKNYIDKNYVNDLIVVNRKILFR